MLETMPVIDWLTATKNWTQTPNPEAETRPLIWWEKRLLLPLPLLLCPWVDQIKGEAMGRTADHSAKLGEGDRAISVGYSAPKRGDFYAVRFTGPDKQRLEKMTKCKNVDANYHIEAARIIVRAFAVSFPKPQRVTWEEALTEVERFAAGDRPDTLRAFRTAVERFRELVPDVEYPADVTPERAKLFGRLILSTPYSRGNSKVKRLRTPKTLDYYRRSLSALWKRLRDMSHVVGNPWEDVPVPEGEKAPIYVPTMEEVNKFFEYIHTRYPKWERLHALLKLKLLSASRTKDVAQLKSSQIANGRFVFAATQTKTKSERSVPLPKDLFDTLKCLGGKEWLWENWNEDLELYRKGRNPIPETFQVETVQCVLENIFREYSDDNPGVPRLSPHDFRRRGITTMVKVTGSVDAAAALLGVSEQTIRNNYLDETQAFEAKGAFERMADSLFGASHQIPTKSGNRGNNLEQERITNAVCKFLGVTRSAGPHSSATGVSGRVLWFAALAEPGSELLTQTHPDCECFGELAHRDQ
jgi:integrase